VEEVVQEQAKTEVLVLVQLVEMVVAQQSKAPLRGIV
jgi:hypothetical protein